MTHRIQITVDDQLNNQIVAGAKTMGLSVSSYARLALISSLPKGGGLLLRGLEDVKQGNVESLTLDEFNKQVDEYL